MLATGIMIKLLNDVQGAILLLEHGLVPQARILLRTGLEALFILKNICEHGNFWRVFIIASERDRLKLQRAIQANSSSWFDEIRPYITQEIIDQLATEVATAAISPQTIAVLAQLVHLGHLYDSIYRLFSQEVHTSARALEQYMIFA